MSNSSLLSRIWSWKWKPSELIPRDPLAVDVEDGEGGEIDVLEAWVGEDFVAAAGAGLAFVEAGGVVERGWFSAVGAVALARHGADDVIFPEVGWGAVC